MSDHKEQYIQIDLQVNTRLTGLATQGRLGGAEFTEAYQLTYQRDKEDTFRKYKEGNEWKVKIYLIGKKEVGRK